MSNVNDSAAVTALDSDGVPFALDFGFPAAPVRTPEDEAAHKALLGRQDAAAAQAYNGAMASGQTKREAARAAGKARRETT